MNIKQESFCYNYLLDYNATQAAIRAGYNPLSARNQGYRLLQDPEILECINQLKKERNEQFQLDTAFILNGIMEVYSQSIQGTLKTYYSKKEDRVYPVLDSMGNEVRTYNTSTSLRALKELYSHLNYYAGDGKSYLKAIALPPVVTPDKKYHQEYISPDAAEALADEYKDALQLLNIKSAEQSPEQPTIDSSDICDHLVEDPTDHIINKMIPFDYRTLALREFCDANKFSPTLPQLKQMFYNQPFRTCNAQFIKAAAEAAAEATVQQNPQNVVISHHLSSSSVQQPTPAAQQNLQNVVIPHHLSSSPQP